jgi:hypothetical protein
MARKTTQLVRIGPDQVMSVPKASLRKSKPRNYTPPWTGVKNVAPMQRVHINCDSSCHCRVLEREAVRLGDADWIGEKRASADKK